MEMDSEHEQPDYFWQAIYSRLDKRTRKFFLRQDIISLTRQRLLGLINFKFKFKFKF